MKKLILFILLTVMLIMPMSAFAETGAGLSASYTTNDSGNIVVYAAIVNINDPTGLCGISYDIIYDNQVLEMVKADVVIPEKWKPFLADEMVENWSAPKSENIYSWALLNCEMGNGIKNDHELCIRIEFKPLSKTSTSVKFICENVINDNVVELVGESKMLNIEIADNSAPENNVSSQPESKPEINEPTASEGVSSETNENSDVISDNVNSESSDVSSSVSENNSVGFDENAGDITSAEESYNEKSDMTVLIDNSNEVNNNADDSANNPNRKTIFVLCIVGAVAVLAVVVFVSQKGKKTKKGKK